MAPVVLHRCAVWGACSKDVIEGVMDAASTGPLDTDAALGRAVPAPPTSVVATPVAGGVALTWRSDETRARVWALAAGSRSAERRHCARRHGT